MIHVILGAIATMCILISIGITQPRGTSVTTWCFFYLLIALTFDSLAIFALLFHFTMLVEVLLGVSVGAATGLALHVAHHIFEEKRQTSTPKQI